MKIRFTGVLLLISLLLLSACGQKGPLYLERTAEPEVTADTVDIKVDTEKTGNAVKSEEKD